MSMLKKITLNHTLTLLAVGSLMASYAHAENANIEYLTQVASAAGSASSIAVICGKETPASLEKHKADTRAKLAKDGLSPSAFDKAYSETFDAGIARAKSDPARAKKGCEQLKAMGEQMSKQGGAAKP